MRSLTANMITAKNAYHYPHIWLVEITVTIGGQDLTSCFSTNRFTIEDREYLPYVVRFGTISEEGPVGGGFAAVGSNEIVLENTTRQMADLMDFFTFEHARFVQYLVFDIPGLVAADKIPMFDGSLQRPKPSRQEVRIPIQDGTLNVLNAIPREVVDLGVDAFAPIGERGKPKPIPFGDNLNGRPITLYSDNYDFRRIVPSVCINQFTRDYVAANCKGDDGSWSTEPLVETAILMRAFDYLAEVDQFLWPAFYGVIDDPDTGVQTIRTYDNKTRHFAIWPIYATTAGGLANEELAMDRDKTTAMDVIDDGSKSATFGFGLSQKVGNLNASNNIILLFEATIDNAAGLKATITHPRLTTIVTELGGGTNTYQFGTAGSVSGGSAGDIAILDAQWDFHALRVKVEQGSGGGNTTIKEVRLHFALDFITTQSYRGYVPLFASLKDGGYRNDTDQYVDGSLIPGVSLGEVLTYPPEQFEAILRDKRTLLALPANAVNTAGMAAWRTFAAAQGIKFSWSFYRQTQDREATREFLADFARQSHAIIRRKADGTWTGIPLDTTQTPVGFFGRHNMGVKNPEAPPVSRRSTLELHQTAAETRFNNYVIRWGYNYQREDYDEILVATGKYLTTRTDVTTDGTGKILTTGTGDLLAIGIRDGHKCYVADGTGATLGVYAIDAVTATTVTIDTDIGANLTAGDVVVYLGPYLNRACVDSYVAAGSVLRTYGPGNWTEWYFINDRAVALALLDLIIDVYAHESWWAIWSGPYQGVDMEIGDVVLIDDKQQIPAVQGARPGWYLGAPMPADATILPLVGPELTAGDHVQIDYEIVKVVSATYPEGDTRDLEIKFDDAASGLSISDTVYPPHPSSPKALLNPNRRTFGETNAGQLIATTGPPDYAFEQPANTTAVVYAADGVADCVCTVEGRMRSSLPSNNGNFWGMIFRWSDTDNYWQIQRQKNGNVVLRKIVAGVGTTIKATGYAIPVEDEWDMLIVGLRGDDIEITLKIGSAAPVFLEPVSDSFNASATIHGLMGWHNGSGTLQWRNWTIDPAVVVTRAASGSVAVMHAGGTYARKHVSTWRLHNVSINPNDKRNPISYRARRERLDEPYLTAVADSSRAHFSSAYYQRGVSLNAWR